MVMRPNEWPLFIWITSLLCLERFGGVGGRSFKVLNIDNFLRVSRTGQRKGWPTYYWWNPVSLNPAQGYPFYKCASHWSLNFVAKKKIIL